jgi:hypothetical protein
MNVSAFGGNAQKEAVIKTISDFCKLEFSYQDTEERDDLIKETLQYRERAEKFGLFAGVLQIDYAYEIFAVKSYKVLDVDINNNKAVATVSYDVLAKRTGWGATRNDSDMIGGRTIFFEYLNPNYIEKINLIFDSGRWWILDPPFPKISANEIILFLKDDMKLLEEDNAGIRNGRAFFPQQNAYNDDKYNIKLLKKLAYYNKADEIVR